MTLNAWTVEQIRDRIATRPPLAPMFNIAILDAAAGQARVRLGPGEHATRPGGSLSGPIQFALADVAIYVPILTGRYDAAAVTVELTIDIRRPAMTLPLPATASPLRSGRRLSTAEVRIVEETTTRLVA
jgi:uncharacterized protein (TIGR00369 family)